MLDRKKVHEIVDLVLNICELGIGIHGFPYADVRITNYGYPVTCKTMKNGYSEYPLIDGYYIVDDDNDSDKDMDICIEELKELLNKAEEMVNV